jgi:hypothetical protein
VPQVARVGSDVGRVRKLLSADEKTLMEMQRDICCLREEIDSHRSPQDHEMNPVERIDPDLWTGGYEGVGDSREDAIATPIWWSCSIA